MSERIIKLLGWVLLNPLHSQRHAPKISEGGLTMSVREIKAARAKHTFFPLRSSLSFMLGPMKVYSAAYTGLDAPPCGSLEVYHSQQIEFIFAMENPEDYSWPES